MISDNERKDFNALNKNVYLSYLNRRKFNILASNSHLFSRFGGNIYKQTDIQYLECLSNLTTVF